MENSFEHRVMPLTSMKSGEGLEVTLDLYCLTVQIANVCMVGVPQAGDWVLIDAGMPRTADMIMAAAAERFGRSSKPKAIILTHGHFDHVGAIVELVEQWQVPVFAHELELPFLTGRSDYPEPDPAVDNGLISELSRYFPNKGIDLGDHVQQLPAGGEVPGLPGWRWIHTPGHTPGHISLFRELDRLLIAGDAFVTVKQESLYKVITQEREMSGPPKYFTTDWRAAWDSVKKLEALKPAAAVTGHGMPMAGEELARELVRLARDFDRIAIPEEGRYVPER